MYPRFEHPELSAAGGDGADRDTVPAAADFAPIDGAFFAGLRAPTSFYFMRHGQSEGNATSTFQGRLEFPLDRTGIAQAEAAAAWFSNIGVEVIASSPQRRAADTARIVAGACGISDIRYLASLVEVDVGLFSGIDAERARREHPEVYARFFHESWDAVPSAEASSSMYLRAAESWRILRQFAENGAGTILCVSHGGLLQWLFRSTFGARSWLPLVPFSNCGISRLDVEPHTQGQPAFLQWSLMNFKAPHSPSDRKPVF